MVIIRELLFLLLLIYLFAIVLRIVLGILKFSHNSFTFFLSRITDPVLLLFKKFTPIKFSYFDLSPLVPIFIIFLTLKFLSDLNRGININFYYLFYFFIYIVDTIYFIYMLSVVVLLITLSIAETFYYSNSFLSYVKNQIYPLVLIIKRCRFKFLKTERGYYLFLCAFFLVLLIIGHTLLKNCYLFFEMNNIKEIITK